LFQAGDPDKIGEARQWAGVGCLVDNGLPVQGSAIDELEPLIRIYEGCTRSWTGEIDDANIIKLHRFSGKVPYLVCPDFDKIPILPLLR